MEMKTPLRASPTKGVLEADRRMRRPRSHLKLHRFVRDAR